jgi:outer membrane protein OmpA-like peptidoglycan-associated protein
MASAIAALAMLSVLDPAPAAAADRDRWIDCSTVESANHRRVIVDNLAYVFFASGSAAITPQAATVLDSFIAGYLAPAGCRVMVEGHADRVGPAAYNLRLSRRRARAVAAYLRRNGFAAPIVVLGSGETRPLVQTADGVAEAQNRNVVVVGIERAR